MADDAPGQHGWVSYTSGPGGKDRLRPEVRRRVERFEAELGERRGRLLCEVTVQVYESDIDDGAMWVSFPAGAALGPDSDPALITGAVTRARAALAHWR